MKKFLAAGAAALMAGTGGALLSALPASADYGQGASFQIEISANIPGSTGGGVWLWLELSPTTSATSGTGDYQGSDCGHKNGPAAHDSGTVNWTESGGVITITGAILNGLGSFPTTITIPNSTYGHYSYTGVGAVMTLPGFIPPTVGFTQLTVAP
jgi:hypothetical protein